MNITMCGGLARIEYIKGYAFKSAVVWNKFAHFAPKTANFMESVSECAHMSRSRSLSPRDAV